MKRIRRVKVAKGEAKGASPSPNKWVVKLRFTPPEWYTGEMASWMLTTEVEVETQAEAVEAALAAAGRVFPTHKCEVVWAKEKKAMAEEQERKVKHEIEQRRKEQKKKAKARRVARRRHPRNGGEG